MKNRILLSGLILLSASPVFAFTTSSYIGLSAGSLYRSADIDTFAGSDVAINGGHVNYSPQQGTANLNHFAALGRIQLGSGVHNDIFYIGLELLGEFAEGDFGTDTQNFYFVGSPSSQLSAKQHLSLNDFQLSLDLKPGVFLSPNTLLYGRVGMAFNKLTLEDNSTYDLIDSSLVITEQVSESKNVTALRLGLGLEYALSEKFSLLMDYTFTRYGDLTLNNLVTGSADLGGTILDFTIDSQHEVSNVFQQSMMIGFNYYL